jgi:hypothetical protein
VDPGNNDPIPEVPTQTVSGNIQAETVIVSSNYEINTTTTTIS